MARLDFTVDSIQREYAEAVEAMSRGIATLRSVADAKIGATPRRAVYQIDKAVLYRYGSDRANVSNRPPILIVYALVNRPEMADLQHGRSMVEGLLARGFDVYLINWGSPDFADQDIGLDTYIARYLNACVDYLLSATRRKRLSLLGICQGGTFSAIYTSLFPHKIDRLVTTVTPIDFHTSGDMISHLVRHVDANLLVDAIGNVDGDILNALFLSLKPFRLLHQKYVKFLNKCDDVDKAAMFLRMEQWIFDSPALTARSAREFAVNFYQQNRLIEGGLRFGGREVDLGRIEVPVLNVYAREDHLVPPASSKALAGLVATSDYREHELSGGHIGIYVGSRNSGSVADVIADWVAERSAG